KARGLVFVKIHKPGHITNLIRRSIFGAMYSIIRKLLFFIDPEKVHYLVMGWLNAAYSKSFVRKRLKKSFTLTHPSLERTLWGITFPNPVGLAAGFDKDAKFT